MEADRSVTVVILYRHPLFGEGIGHLLSNEPDMVVACAASDDPDAVAEVLARDPNVVIFERGDPDMAVEILRYAPEALLIDVTMDPGPAFAWHREEIQSRPDGIVGAIRAVRKPDRPAVVGSAASEASIAAGIRAVGGI
jgi:DNA-binding NarL/FixJ family response regulator